MERPVRLPLARAVLLATRLSGCRLRALASVKTGSRGNVRSDLPGFRHEEAVAGGDLGQFGLKNRLCKIIPLIPHLLGWHGPSF